MKIVGNHLEDLYKSGLSDEFLEFANVYSIEKKELEERLGFKVNNVESAIVFPYSKDFERYKCFPPFQPLNPEEKPIKYLQKRGSGVHLYKPFPVENADTIFITEGEKKALKANQEGIKTLGLGGIWNWKTKDSDEPIDEIKNIGWVGKKAVIVPDNDWIGNGNVMLATHRLGTELEKLGADVEILSLPQGEQKIGLDDYLINHPPKELRKLPHIKLGHKIFKANGIKKKKPELTYSYEGLKGEVGYQKKVIDELGYAFRKNDITRRYEFNLNKTGWREMKDKDFSTLYCLLRQYDGLEGVSQSNLRALIESDICSYNYDPFFEYFDNLQWDGRDHIADLCMTLRFQEETLRPFYHQLIKYWLIATAGCMVNEKTVNDAVLVLKGPQNIGKSTWLNNLIEGTDIEEYLIITKCLKSGDKDSMLSLTEKGVINLDELSSLSKREADETKYIISKPKESLRAAYGRYTENYVRRASFCATTNKDEFLTDLTGNRRWWILDTLDIYHDEYNSIDQDQVWAQAYSLFKKGERYRLSKEEIKYLNDEITDQCMVTSIEEDLLLKFCRPALDGESGEFMTATELAMKLKAISGADYHLNNSVVVSLGKLLNKHEFKSKAKGKERRKKYEVVWCRAHPDE